MTLENIIEGYVEFDFGKKFFYVRENIYNDLRKQIDNLITLVKLLEYDLQYGFHNINESNLIFFSSYMKIILGDSHSISLHFVVDGEDNYLKGVKMYYTGQTGYNSGWGELKRFYNEIIDEIKDVENFIAFYGHKD